MIVDTSFVLDVIDDVDAAVETERELEESEVPLIFPAMTVLELYVGAGKVANSPAERRQVEAVSSAYPVDSSVNEWLVDPAVPVSGSATPSSRRRGWSATNRYSPAILTSKRSTGGDRTVSVADTRPRGSVTGRVRTTRYPWHGRYTRRSRAVVIISVITGIQLCGVPSSSMLGVLNEHTETVHRWESGRTEFDTACGATNYLDPGQLREIPVERATAEHDASRCGRCFDDGGGY